MCFSRKAFVESAVFINLGRALYVGVDVGAYSMSVFMSVVSFGFTRGREGFPRCV